MRRWTVQGYATRFARAWGGDSGLRELAVRDELEQVAGRSPSSGSLYTTLDRMERKGLITSTEGETSGERGGRPRRDLAVTPEGRDALARSRSTLLRLWDGLESALDRPCARADVGCV